MWMHLLSRGARLACTGSSRQADLSLGYPDQQHTLRLQRPRQSRRQPPCASGACSLLSESTILLHSIVALGSFLLRTIATSET